MPLAFAKLFLPDELLTLKQTGLRVYDLIMEGKAEKEIAYSLALSPNTVHTHVKRIYRMAAVRGARELQAMVIARQTLLLVRLDKAAFAAAPHGDELTPAPALFGRPILVLSSSGEVRTYEQAKVEGGRDADPQTIVER